MGELIEVLRQRLPAASMRTNTRVDAIDDRGGRYVLTLGDGSRLTTPRLLLATPPAVTARLLRPVDADLSALCGRIRSASVVTVALGYPRAAVAHPLHGAGIVVPRREGMSLRALSWVSSKWEGRAPAGHVLLRAYVGGIQDPEAIDRSDAEILKALRRDLARLIGATGEPDLTRLYRWRDATPQLEVGHAALMAQIEGGLGDRSGLAVTASGFRGTGIADCVGDARRQAAQLADRPAAASHHLSMS
jgi:oxygen-dependent protoporphyrinogen oxidase